jgi:transcriptional regulator with PAS, ATPase and Fis domain
LELNARLLPVVNSKKQFLGIVTREALEQALLTEDRVQEANLGKSYEQGFGRTDSHEPLTYSNLVKDSQELKERTQMLLKMGLITYAPEMMDLVDLSLRVAKVTSTVLISGESGVGKELFAKLLHEQSPRSSAPFMKVNCAAIPENLLESELFGYDSGAFTGASRQGKLGMFELANEGTLFLDEIGELPLTLQVKLLRAVQEQEILRIGGIKVRKVDIRFIAATNRDLERMVKEGKFREDLYFRLNVIPLHVPPLRRRKHDILPLVHHFQQKFVRKLSIEKEFAPEVLKAFYKYNWPGNVRELENIIERLCVITPERIVSPKYLPKHYK